MLGQVHGQLRLRRRQRLPADRPSDPLFPRGGLLRPVAGRLTAQTGRRGTARQCIQVHLPARTAMQCPRRSLVGRVPASPALGMAPLKAAARHRRLPRARNRYTRERFQVRLVRHQLREPHRLDGRQSSLPRGLHLVDLFSAMVVCYLGYRRLRPL